MERDDFSLDGLPNGPVSNPSHYTTGIKYDQDKPRFDLIPTDALTDLAKLYAQGAKKYAERNWENGLDFSRVYRACIAHLLLFFEGEDKDPETHVYHTTAIAWNAFALTHFLSQYDKYQKFDNRPCKKEALNEPTTS